MTNKTKCVYTIIVKNGPYELVKAPDNYPGKKYRGKYCYEHILVYWQNNGKVPEKGFEIHHLNMEHRDNRIENLQLMTGHEHRKIHAGYSKVPLKIINCFICNNEHKLAARNYRYKSKRGQKNFFCSKNCLAEYNIRFKNSRVP